MAKLRPPADTDRQLVPHMDLEYLAQHDAQGLSEIPIFDAAEIAVPLGRRNTTTIEILRQKLAESGVTRNSRSESPGIRLAKHVLCRYCP